MPELAAAFHTTLVAVTAELVARAVADGAPRTVCLSGGCFTNRRLLSGVRSALRDAGLTVLVGSAVPVGDGGIGYGQAAVAAARLGEGDPGCAWACRAGSRRSATTADCAWAPSTSGAYGAGCAWSTRLGRGSAHT
ncbi:hypothetical protein NKH77_50950 [Streptomyces sp. M19]